MHLKEIQRGMSGERNKWQVTSYEFSSNRLDYSQLDNSSTRN